jgi:D-lactate dehydrogenase
MKVALFSTRKYDRRFFDIANEQAGHELVYFDAHLAPQTAMLADGFPAVCAFVNDQLNGTVVAQLAAQGTRLIALRCAGFNHVDLRATDDHGIAVTRVPAYSPHATAEHAVALMLTLNRRIHKAYNRVREMNFSLEGLLGFDMRTRTAGIVGTGNIGALVARILTGFGCKVLAYDIQPNPDVEALGAEYVEPSTLLAESDIITLHCPLVPATHHLIGTGSLAQMKDGVMLINTSRGALIDTQAVIKALKQGRIGALGLDVYEEEEDLFFEDLSGTVIQDDTFARLLTFPNVIITGHQGFFTSEALQAIADQAIHAISAFEKGQDLPNVITSELMRR